MKRIISMFISAAFVLSLCFVVGCSHSSYKVDYCGKKQLYDGAEDSYKAGTDVTLYYGFIATDTNYSFLLDGKLLSASYDDQKGYVIRFIMPDHNVKLECITKKSMTEMP